MATKTALHNGSGTMARSHAADVVQEHKVAVAPKRRKVAVKKADDGLVAALCTMVCEHQIGTVFKTAFTAIKLLTSMQASV